MKNIKWPGFFPFILIFIIGCQNQIEEALPDKVGFSIVVLGIAQDAGFPQSNCQKDCCKEVWKDSSKRKMVSCLAILDHINNKYWIIDATPDFKDQISLAQKSIGSSSLPDGIFLTHAHIGHYTGLAQLGREAIGSNKVKVYAMPRMRNYLRTNGPWSQLVDLENIVIEDIENKKEINISKELKVKPFLVPHRDEFSETIGYEITGPSKRVLFIPDIDKWEKWDQDIRSIISKVDYAFLDGSFYRNGEIPGRDMSLIPHPFIEESMALFQTLQKEEKSKIFFIHFNHTNPVLDRNSTAYKYVIDRGYNIAQEGKYFDL